MSASDDVRPVTDRVHEASWSANLERDQYAEDRDLLVEHAKEAVRRTVPGTHVNLVTHAAHGHPDTYLCEALRTTFDDVETEYVERCGCGGHVLRVTCERN